MSPGPDDEDGLRTEGPRPDGLRTDGLPTLPTGEPVLHRWFVLTMLALAPVAIGVTAWALLSIPSGDLPPAERRPPGGPEVTIARGDIALATSDDTEAGPACAEGVTLVGDSGSRAAGRRALGATCQLIARGDLPRAAQGLEEWLAAGAVLRMGTFEFSGVESSARIEDGRMIVELNAKFIFDDATRAAPALLHQLVLIADGGWPGATVSAASELEAARVQATACGRLSFGGARPRGCLDVDELLALDDPLAAIAAAGFRTS